MMQTINEQLALERLARKHERHLKFMRHSPREERWIPFIDTTPDTKSDVAWSLVGIAVLAVGCFLVLGLS